jgi:hypothetical protein
MKTPMILSLVLLVLNSMVLTGCGSDPEMVQTYSVSVGQQLTDLDRTRQEGLITEREYKRLRKALIDRYD